MKILKLLQDAGHQAYLVGGCVRDLLLGLHPKDFDISTSATLEQVRRIVPGSTIIGRRFPLVLVRRRDRQFEIASFESVSLDAVRRDFTVNGIFYDPIEHDILDQVGGMNDIKAKVIRMIGDPHERLLEDPLRSLRALRFRNKLGFAIEEKLREEIFCCSQSLSETPLPRKREDYLKALKLKNSLAFLLEMWDLGLIHNCFPSLVPILEAPDGLEEFITHYLFYQDFVWNEWNEVSRESWHYFFPLVATYWDGLGAKNVIDLKATDSEGSESDDVEEEETDEVADDFVRKELGIFRAEHAMILGLYRLSHTLPSSRVFAKRGQRRKEALLRQPFFKQAVRLAHQDQRLDWSEWRYWLSVFRGES